MARAALDSFRRTVTVTWPKQQQAEGKILLVQMAKNGHAKIMADAKAQTGGYPQYEAYANHKGNAVENVTLPGPIVYQYRYFSHVVETILTELQKVSPVESGTYVGSHVVFIDGAPAETIPEIIKSDQEIWIVNTTPYARRLEIGKTESGRDFLVSVPNKIYERTAKKMSRRFSNQAKITFDYVTLPEAYRLKNNQAARHWVGGRRGWYVEPKQRSDRAKGAAVRNPAIVIKALS